MLTQQNCIFGECRCAGIQLFVSTHNCSLSGKSTFPAIPQYAPSDNKNVDFGYMLKSPRKHLPYLGSIVFKLGFWVGFRIE